MLGLGLLGGPGGTPPLTSFFGFKSRTLVFLLCSLRAILISFPVGLCSYCLFATVCGSGLFSSNRALTFWISAACSLSRAVKTSILFCC